MSFEKVTFPGSLGETLAARLDFPASPPRAFALFAHCFACSKDILAAAHVSTALMQQGWAVLRFDFTGLGTSDGDFANTNFSSNIADLIAAADYMRETYEAPKLLVGHSLGGSAVLMAAAQVPEAVAVATIGAPSDPAHVAHKFSEHVQIIEQQGEAEVTLGGRPFKIKKQFLDDIRNQKLLDAVGSLKKTLMVMHAPLDRYVDIENASRIFKAAKHPKSFVSLDNADHLLTRKNDAYYVGQVLNAWTGRYLENKTQWPDLPSAVAGTILIRETGTEKSRAEE